MKILFCYDFVFFHLFSKLREKSFSNNSHPAWPILTIWMMSIPLVLFIAKKLPESIFGTTTWFMALFLSLGILNHLYFLLNGKWKKIVLKYDLFDRDILESNGIIVDVVIAALVVSVFFV